MISKRAGLALNVWGEPGIGKTYAVSTLLRELPCRSATLHAAAPNSAWTQVLPRPERLPAWAERLIARLEQGGGLEGKALADLLLAWLEALAPFVLHVEDLHEGNPARQALLRALALMATRARGVGFIVTSRLKTETPFESYQWLPLDTAGAKALLLDIAGATLPSEALDWIIGQAGGNPLFVLEFFRHLTRWGHLWSDGNRWRWRTPERDHLPTTIEAIIADHMHNAAITPEAQATLVARAVLPLEVSEALWAEVANISPAALNAGRLELERGNVLRGHAFIHPLYQETLRANLAFSERRNLARRAVSALAEMLPLAAVEFITDAELSPREAAPLIERAYQQALETGNTGSAAHLLERLASYDPPEVQAERLLEAARLARTVNLALALELSKQALAVDCSRLEARLLTAELLAMLGLGDEAEALLGDLLTQADPRVFETQVRIKHHRHDYTGVLRLWNQRKTTDANPTTQAMIARAMVQINQLEQAERLLAQALSAPKLEHLELAELLYIRAFVPYFAGQYAAAEGGFSAFLHTLAALSDGSMRYREMHAGALQLRAYMRNLLGRPTQAASDVHESLLLYADIGDAGHYAQLQSELGLYLLESGDYAAAEDALHESRAVLERIDNPIYLSMLERIEARLHLERNEPHGDLLALKHARASLAQIERAGRPPSFTAGAIFVVAWAEARHGAAEAALALADDLVSLGRQSSNRAGADWVRGLALERLGRIDEARCALQASVDSATPMRLGPSLERMALELDRVNGDAASARQRRDRFRLSGAHGPERIAELYFPTPEVQAAVGPAALRLEVLGPMRLGGTDLALPHRGKAQEFLLLLLEARMAGKSSSADLELFDALYPGWPETKALSALKQLVYRLRTLLGAATILRADGGYALGALESDAERFLHSGDTRLWRGPYRASGISNASEMLIGRLRERALALETLEPREAARIANILFEMDPFDREALDLGKRTLIALGDTVGLNRLVMRARSEFAALGESFPESPPLPS